MKREGRQHGTVETYRLVQSRRRGTAQSAQPSPTAALFTRVSQKPTNHSKYTGKCARPRCAGCHTHPVEKSKYKAKGTQRLKYSDVVTNHRLVNWRVVDYGFAPGLKLIGSSATEVLDNLADDDYYLDEIEDDDDDESDVRTFGCDSDLFYARAFGYDLDELEGVADQGQGEGGDDDDDDEDDDKMSFCDVGFVWEEVEGDGGVGWCMVEMI